MTPATISIDQLLKDKKKNLMDRNASKKPNRLSNFMDVNVSKFETGQRPIFFFSPTFKFCKTYLGDQ